MLGNSMVIDGVRINDKMIFVGQTYKNKTVYKIESTSTSRDRETMEEVVLLSSDRMIAVIRNFTEQKSTLEYRLGTNVVERIKFHDGEYYVCQRVNGLPITRIGVYTTSIVPDTRIYFSDAAGNQIACEELCDYVEIWYRPYSLPF
ncbi:hypothetical protein [Anaerovibrio sp.]|uniref:hypothetical protein n=1 Tax=Anaerovibrio sp. TaxID=1872532 RepID=UPI003F1736D2